MTGANYHIHKYVVLPSLQCSKLFYSKVSSGFLRQGSRSLCSFGKIKYVESPELSEEKTYSFNGERFHTSISHNSITPIFSKKKTKRTTEAFSFTLYSRLLFEKCETHKQLKEWEKFYQHKLKTFYPLGLNKKGEYSF